MTVCALVVTYRSENLVLNCVRAAIEAGVDEVVVWDNSPDERTVAVLAEAAVPGVVVGRDGINHGFGGGVNRAAALAEEHDFVLLLNPDCILNAAALRGMREAFAQEKVGIVAPRMLYPDGRYGIAGGPTPSVLKEVLALTRIDDLLPGRLRRWILERLFRGGASGSASYGESMLDGGLIQVDWVSGFCALLPRSLLTQINGFDEDFFLYFEDVDLCRRIAETGRYAFVDRSVSAVHFESVSMAMVGKSRHYFDGLRTYIGKHGTRVEAMVAKPLGGRR